MTRFNFLKHVQHCDAHTSTRKNEKEKKDKNIQITSFWNTCNIMTYFEKITSTT